jgi:hypothetical protein
MTGLHRLEYVTESGLLVFDVMQGGYVYTVRCIEHDISLQNRQTALRDALWRIIQPDCIVYSTWQKADCRLSEIICVVCLFGEAYRK